MHPTTDLYDDYGDIATTCAIQFRDFGARTRYSMESALMGDILATVVQMHFRNVGEQLK